MKHFKMLNSQTGKQFIVTEEGKNLTMKDKKLGKICTVVGECDDRGEVLSGKIEPKQQTNESPTNDLLSKDKKVVVEPKQTSKANGKNKSE